MNGVGPSADVIVVGTGIIGTTTALSALDKGMRVTIVGPGPMEAGGASSAAGAMLGVLSEVTAADTDPQDEAELRFRHASAQRWPALAERLYAPTTPVTVKSGTAIVAIPRANQLDRANLTAIAAAAQRLGARHEEIDPAELTSVRPAPGFDPAAALFLPDEGYVDMAIAMPAAFEAVCRHERARYLPGWVREVSTDTSHVSGVVLSDGTSLPSGNVVIAAGVGTAGVLETLGKRPGRIPAMLAGKGVSLVFEAPHLDLRYVVRSPNRDFACGVHMIPRSSGNVYVGATNRISTTPGAGTGPTGGEVHALLHAACHELHTGLRVAEIRGIRHGMRPLTADSYPLIGRTGLPGLLIATGTYRNGVLLAPAIADVISSQLAGETLDGDLTNPFAPVDTFRTDQPPLRQQIIDQGAVHLASMLMDPGGHLPYERQRELAGFLGALLAIALTDDPQAIGRRDRARALLHSLPQNEAIVQMFYEFSDNAFRAE